MALGCERGLLIELELFSLLHVGDDHVEVKVVAEIIDSVHVDVLVDEEFGDDVEISGGPLLIGFFDLLNELRFFLSCDHPDLVVWVGIVQDLS